MIKYKKPITKEATKEREDKMKEIVDDWMKEGAETGILKTSLLVFALHMAFENYAEQVYLEIGSQNFQEHLIDKNILPKSY